MAYDKQEYLIGQTAVCINNNNRIPTGDTYPLTIGKSYIIDHAYDTDSDGIMIKVINDNMYLDSYYLKRFKVVSVIREEKLNLLLS